MDIIKRNLKYLMEKRAINETDLAKATGVKQSVLNRILTGKTPQPRVSTLLAFAQYFNVGVDDLVGHKISFSESFIPSNMTNHPNIEKLNDASIVPILKYKDILAWCAFNLLAKDVAQHTICSVASGVKTFAMICHDTSMEPELPKGCILFFDPDGIHQDGDLVLLHDSLDNNIFLRRFLKNGQANFIEPLNRQFPAQAMASSHQTLATVCAMQIDQQHLQTYLKRHQYRDITLYGQIEQDQDNTKTTSSTSM